MYYTYYKEKSHGHIFSLVFVMKSSLVGTKITHASIWQDIIHKNPTAHRTAEFDMSIANIVWKHMTTLNTSTLQHMWWLYMTTHTRTLTIFYGSIVILSILASQFKHLKPSYTRLKILILNPNHFFMPIISAWKKKRCCWCVWSSLVLLVQ